MKLSRFALTCAFATALCSTALCTSGTWAPLAQQPTFTAAAQLLLTDGTVLVQDADASDWWKLTPDIKGSYTTGTWTQVASMPTGYGPLYFGSAVLPDGKVVVEGGEYNLSGTATWVNQGALYDPAANTWTSLTAPDGGAGDWANVGDAQSIVLSDGRFLVANISGPEVAALNESTHNFSDVAATGKADRYDEEGWIMLPGGDILTIDTTNGKNTEIYTPNGDLAGSWTTAGNTISSLVDTTDDEIGPMVLRYNGTVFAAGGNGATGIYTVSSNTWSAGPTLPLVNTVQMVCADAAACVLPDDNVLVEAAPGYTQSGVQFYEFDGSTLTAVANPPDAAIEPAYVCTMLMLPTGQVLETDQSENMEVYTPAGSPSAAWEPKISSVSTTLAAGSNNNVLTGTQLNGLSGCSGYGDDVQNATNYPIVKIVNNSTSDVFYCKTHDHSTMGVATGQAVVSTEFNVPAGLESGPSTLYVIANGISSTGVTINQGAGGAAIASMKMVPSASILGGATATGEVVLNQKAGAGGVQVALSSASPSVASVSSTVTVPAGQNYMTFPVTTVPVNVSTPVTLTGQTGSAQASTTVTLTEAVVSAVKVSPLQIPGGDAETGEVVLNGKAAVGGDTVSLLSSNPAVASVGTTVSVPSGQVYATFPISTTPVDSSTDVKISAEIGTSIATTTLTVTPPSLVFLNASPNSVIGGTSATGQAYLNGKAGPSGLSFTLSSNSAFAQVVPNARIAGGASEGSFTITTSAVSSSSGATITVTIGTVSKSATLTVNPALVSLVKTIPTSIKGGSKLTGEVALNGKAGSLNTTVTLSSSNPSVASVPAMVVVPAGQNYMTFPMTTTAVSQTTAVILTATTGVDSVTCTLTVTN